MSEQRTCGICGAVYPAEELYPFAGEELCPQCLGDRTVICQHCGDRIWAENSAGSSDIPLCQDCFDDHYTHCCNCGILLHESSTYYEEDDEYDEHPYCASCYHQQTHDHPIQSYYYKPEPIFYGEGSRFFGVELEIDEGGEDKDNARSLLEVANRERDYFYIKHDGSLNDGMELVTHPLSLEYQLHHVPWNDLCRKAVSLGYLSHRASTCGLHVHVSRTAFGAEEKMQDEAIARVLYFFEKHWEELLKFSRRTPRQLERWAARYGYKEHPKEILDFAKKGYHGGRYTCVNLQNDSTVEFRMFRGTLRASTILATLELLDRICDLAVCLDDEELKAVPWTSFVTGISEERYPELVQYLKERRLYVNEPVEVGVED